MKLKPINIRMISAACIIVAAIVRDAAQPSLLDKDERLALAIGVHAESLVKFLQSSIEPDEGETIPQLPDLPLPELFGQVRAIAVTAFRDLVPQIEALVPLVMQGQKDVGRALATAEDLKKAVKAN